MNVVTPLASALNGGPEQIGPGVVAGPDGGAQAIRRVVGKRERFFLGVERRNRDYRSENLLLEDAHLVVALEHSRLNEEAVLEVATEVCFSAPGEHLGAFLSSDIDEHENFLQLLAGELASDHR